MSTTQFLGGTRQSSPLEDEMVYPLSNDEFLLIKDNIVLDKFTNWESFLLTTGVTSLISLFVIWFTGSLEIKTISDGKEIIEINITQIVTLIIYGALGLGSLLGYFIFRYTKKDAAQTMKRLESKIEIHLQKGQS